MPAATARSAAAPSTAAAPATRNRRTTPRAPRPTRFCPTPAQAATGHAPRPRERAPAAPGCKQAPVPTAYACPVLARARAQPQPCMPTRAMRQRECGPAHASCLPAHCSPLGCARARLLPTASKAACLPACLWHSTGAVLLACCGTTRAVLAQPRCCPPFSGLPGGGCLRSCARSFWPPSLAPRSSYCQGGCEIKCPKNTVCRDYAPCVHKSDCYGARRGGACASHAACLRGGRGGGCSQLGPQLEPRSTSPRPSPLAWLLELRSHGILGCPACVQTTARRPPAPMLTGHASTTGRGGEGGREGAGVDALAVQPATVQLPACPSCVTPPPPHLLAPQHLLHQPDAVAVPRRNQVHGLGGWEPGPHRWQAPGTAPPPHPPGVANHKTTGPGPAALPETYLIHPCGCNLLDSRDRLHPPCPAGPGQVNGQSPCTADVDHRCPGPFDDFTCVDKNSYCLGEGGRGGTCGRTGWGAAGAVPAKAS